MHSSLSTQTRRMQNGDQTADLRRVDRRPRRLQRVDQRGRQREGRAWPHHRQRLAHHRLPGGGPAADDRAPGCRALHGHLDPRRHGAHGQALRQRCLDRVGLRRLRGGERYRLGLSPERRPGAGPPGTELQRRADAAVVRSAGGGPSAHPRRLRPDQLRRIRLRRPAGRHQHGVGGHRRAVPVLRRRPGQHLLRRLRRPRLHELRRGRAGGARRARGNHRTVRDRDRSPRRRIPGLDPAARPGRDPREPPEPGLVASGRWRAAAGAPDPEQLPGVLRRQGRELLVRHRMHRLRRLLPRL